jgi:molybdopterin synthase sulfur carrier subunit
VIKVKVHTILGLKQIIGRGEIEVSIPHGSTVRAFVSWMVKTYGQKLSSQLCEPGTVNLLPHIRLMVNGQSIRFLDGLETMLDDGDEVLLLPPVAGG